MGAICPEMTQEVVGNSPDQTVSEATQSLLALALPFPMCLREVEELCRPFLASFRAFGARHLLFTVRCSPFATVCRVNKFDDYLALQVAWFYGRETNSRL